ncbi:hypothetical protein TNIN_107601 [Trichonephila inaurata madagascariensis]|uniref:Uncharacterized protein n=1 Tax=Trichonephila inaurata madagascariensis TaxID=2747483 RepID=A0A8X7BPN9_9ARAC|nr:hypothetical protein TNIN_107601 [Trichonephila inaurata madagascariensis]
MINYGGLAFYLNWITFLALLSFVKDVGASGLLEGTLDGLLGPYGIVQGVLEGVPKLVGVVFQVVGK